MQPEEFARALDKTFYEVVSGSALMPHHCAVKSTSPLTRGISNLCLEGI